MKKIILILIAVIVFLVVFLSMNFLTPQETTIIIATDYMDGECYIVSYLQGSDGEYFYGEGDIKITCENGTVLKEFHQEIYSGTYTPVPAGNYTVELTYYGDIYHKSAHTVQDVEVSENNYYNNNGSYISSSDSSSNSSEIHFRSSSSDSSFNPYTYYDTHNWGENQRIDDYIEDNYWDEEIYDNPSTYDGECP